MRRSVIQCSLAMLIASTLAACSLAPASNTGALPSRSAESGAGDRGSALRTSVPELVYVPRADGAITVYDPHSDGYAEPIVRIPDPSLANATWNPWGVAFDPSGFLYVQSFHSKATTFVFAPGADEDSRPARVFMADGPATRAIAVDPDGYEYIATGEQSAEIDVVAPKANGNPRNSYAVPIIRSMYTDEAPRHPWPSILTADAKGEVIAGIVHAKGNALEVFEGGRTGPGGPIREIMGSKTLLGTCEDRICENIVVAYSAHDNRIYVGVSQGANTHISSFAADAAGNVSPLQTIEGANTGLPGNVITGITVNARTGEIYVMSKLMSTFGHGWVQDYAPGSTGNVAPLHTFTDPDGFYDAKGIAISH